MSAAGSFSSGNVQGYDAHMDSPDAGPSSAGGTFSAAVTSPLGLSVLALSVAAVARFHPWRTVIPSSTTEEKPEASPYKLAVTGGGGESTTAATTTTLEPASQSDAKKRSKDRYRRAKGPSKSALNKIIQTNQSTPKATTPSGTKHDNAASSISSRSRETTSYATSSAHSSTPPTSHTFLDDDTSRYAQSVGSEAPSTLGDELSSADGVETREHVDEFASVSGKGGDEEDDVLSTPIAQPAASERGLPALATLRLPRAPLRPSKMTVRVLNAYADGPRIKASSSSSMISESTSSRTILASSRPSPPPQYTSHSPAPSNATSSTTTTNAVSSSASSSQLSPQTPPAHLSMTPGSLPLHTLLGTPVSVLEKEDEDDILTPLQEDVEHSSSSWIERVPPRGPRSTPRAASHAHSGTKPRDRTKLADRAHASSTLDALAENNDDPARTAISSSVSAPTALRPLNSAWDHSLDWGPTLGSAREADEDAEGAGMSSEERESAASPSYPWGGASAGSEDREGGMMDDPSIMRGRRPSNATQTTLVASTVSAEENDDSMEVEDADAQPAVLDIMFPSLNDPPLSPYVGDQCDGTYDDGSGIAALRVEVEELKMREERWRMECQRLAGEYERVRWAWTEEITKWTRRESELRAQLLHATTGSQSTNQPQSGPATSTAPSTSSTPHPSVQSRGGLTPSSSGNMHHIVIPPNPFPQQASQPLPSPYGGPGMPLQSPMHMNMQFSMGMGMGMPSPNGMMPMMAFPIPVRPGPQSGGMLSPSGSMFGMGPNAMPNGNGIANMHGPGVYGGGPGSRPSSTAPSSSSRHGSYGRGNRAGSRSRSRAPSPFIGTNPSTSVDGLAALASSGSAGRLNGSPKKHANANGSSGTPPTAGRNLPASRSVSSNGSAAMRSPVIAEALEGGMSTSSSMQDIAEEEHPGPGPGSVFDSPSSRLRTTVDSDDDDISDALASAILRNPGARAGSTSRSSSRASSNMPMPMIPSGLSALQQLPSPLPPLTRSYSTSSTSSSNNEKAMAVLGGVGGEHKDIPAVVDEDEKTPEAELKGVLGGEAASETRV